MQEYVYKYHSFIARMLRGWVGERMDYSRPKQRRVYRIHKVLKMLGGW